MWISALSHLNRLFVVVGRVLASAIIPVFTQYITKLIRNPVTTAIKYRLSSDPVLSTAEVAEQVPLKRQATYNRLRSLAVEGRLESKQIGGRNTV